MCKSLCFVANIHIDLWISCFIPWSLLIWLNCWTIDSYMNLRLDLVRFYWSRNDSLFQSEYIDNPSTLICTVLNSPAPSSASFKDWENLNFGFFHFDGDRMLSDSIDLRFLRFQRHFNSAVDIFIQLEETLNICTQRDFYIRGIVFYVPCEYVLLILLNDEVSVFVVTE